MDVQVSEVSSTSLDFSTESHQTDEESHPLGSVQDSTVSSTTGVHDPSVVAALVQLLNSSLSSATRITHQEVVSAAVQLLDEQIITIDDLWELVEANNRQANNG